MPASSPMRLRASSATRPTTATPSRKPSRGIHRADRAEPPNRRVKPQDGRPLRRYTRRWKFERLFAWLQNFLCILRRHDCNVLNYLRFVPLGCIVILLRRCLGNHL